MRRSLLSLTGEKEIYFSAGAYHCRNVNRRVIRYAGENTVGGSVYYETKTAVVFRSAMYATSAPINIYKGIGLIAEGQAILKANPTDQSFKCFVGMG
ncbi:hypothetical protein PAESOLCIP111_06604 [Paenibacillus solanacearum]|uniref:Uncharacterized protein n=1 Tax=Paenibacillus solanacearum TaxID=2048548 RepID=A0A916KAM1_9BACL|nr:hypothetical protein [Paenibacillus solanacearum]CAG7652692.1 hypothetical protein PAESOLCIP111_06604 [Paenibacillus solanacearum]